MSFEKFVPFKKGEIALLFVNRSSPSEAEIFIEDILSKDDLNAPEDVEHPPIADWRFVTLHFDKERKLIGISPASKPGSDNTTAYDEDGGLRISCGSFCRFYNILPEGLSLKLKAVWDSKGNMLIAKLPEGF
jgi:hypothetical protein